MKDTTTDFLPAERADEILLQSQIDLIAADAPLRFVMEAMPIGVALLNEQRQVVEHNRRFAEQFRLQENAIGMRPGELLHCVHAWENAGGCGTSQFCTQCGLALAIYGAARGSVARGECRISLQPDAAMAAVDIRVWATPYEKEGARFTLVAAENIAHEKRRSILERVFLHNMRNHIGALFGIAQLFTVADQRDLDEIHEFGALMTEAATQLLEEVDAQRQLLAAESGELSVRRAVLDTKGLVHSLVEQYRSHEVSQGRHLQMNPGSEAHLVDNDRALLIRVLGNMIKNALEASARGEQVTVGCERQDAEIRFWVHNPSFIPRNVQLQLFQRSYSTKGADRGLGTYSMKLLTERYLGGRVDFTSTQVGGTTFMVYIPA